MVKMAEHKHAEVLRAIADGKEVQCKYKDERDWEDYNEDLHASPLDCTELLEWRVKPEPLAWLEGQEFYEVCQEYRHAKDCDKHSISASQAYEELKNFIRLNVEKF